VIEKMKFLTISGPKDDIDRVVNTYLSKYQIHLEHALTELKSVRRIMPYIEINPYKEMLLKSDELTGLLKKSEASAIPEIPIEEALKIIQSAEEQYTFLKNQKDELNSQQAKLISSLQKITPFQDLNYDLSSILHFKYVKFRFGRIGRDDMLHFEKYIYERIDTFFAKCHEDKEYVYGAYFVPASMANKIDAIYASMHFERFFLPDEYKGTPREAAEQLTRSLSELSEKISTLETQITDLLNKNSKDLFAAHEKLKTYSSNFDIRRLAACTDEKSNNFYILCGWMTEHDTALFQNDVANDDHLFCIIEDDHNNILSKPPTKLKNPQIFKPFEMFVRMYGLPSYNEMDPTILMCLTYSFFFGFMFGDVGQGLCLLIGGFLLYKFKKMDLAAIISCAGAFSAFFGFLFGSVFGFEEIIEPLWLRPASHMTNLPFIGTLNTVFIVAIALGMGTILFTMLLHIKNAIKIHDVEAILFDSNGVAGLIFYAAIVATVVLYMTGNPIPATAVLAVMFGLPLLAIAFKEPLMALIEKKAEILPKQKGMFIVQGFFELFELLLSYFSNTLSFVRVGAFAVSHAAMMNVVLMLAGATEGGSPNYAVIVLGNLFVCGMEGLIVGIQVLRLEYYELFSRFYKGEGREFVPYSKREQRSR